MKIRPGGQVPNPAVGGVQHPGGLLLGEGVGGVVGRHLSAVGVRVEARPDEEVSQQQLLPMQPLPGQITFPRTAEFFPVKKKVFGQASLNITYYRS